MRRDSRTGFDLEVTFTHPETGETQETYVYIPFEVYVEALRQYCANYKDVALDGTDNRIWNLFADIDGALDYFCEDEYFLDICRELYENSYEYEEDFEEWKDDYDMDHEIGVYAIDNEE